MMIATSNSQTRRVAVPEIAQLVECASLRTMELFRDVTSSDLARVAGITRFQAVDKRTRIAVQNDPGNLCFLMDGLAKVSRLDGNGGETVLYLMKPGEACGTPVSDHRDDVCIMTLQSSVVARVRVRELEQIVGSARVQAEISRIRSLRMAQMEDRLDEMSGRVPARTARILLRLCKEFPKALHCGTKVNVLLTQQDIASMIGATREVTSSTLNVFRRRGWLGIHDRYMCIHDADGLYEATSCASAI
ncbi:MAG: Crp/Fnr family transcriptional regulator [Candidatus Latescibacteria bacterium]|nr:Crp/Fnr family transcriptional regulator [Candidatus Latescibacterota bacterium]